MYTYLLAIFCAVNSQTSDLPLQGVIGLTETVIYDTLTETTDPALEEFCIYWRARKTSFDFSTSQSGKIYYTSGQCRDANQNVLYQKFFYAYNESDPGVPLPPGCPPPSIAPFQQSNPCNDAMNDGADFARIVARLTVPLAMQNATDNPLQNSLALLNYLNSSAGLQQAMVAGLSANQQNAFSNLTRATQNQSTIGSLSADQQNVFNNLTAAIYPIVKSNLDCVLAIVASPGSELPLSAICMQKGAYKYLQKIIQDTLAEQILCGSVGCTPMAIAQAKTSAANGTGGSGTGGSGTGGSGTGGSGTGGSGTGGSGTGGSGTGAASGVQFPDILTPNDGETYLIVSYSTGYVMAYAPTGYDDSVYFQTCKGTSDQLWTFLKQADGTWVIQSNFTGTNISYSSASSPFIVKPTTPPGLLNSFVIQPYPEPAILLTTTSTPYKTMAVFSMDYITMGSLDQQRNPYAWVNPVVLRKGCATPATRYPQPAVPYSPALSEHSRYFVINVQTGLAMSMEQTSNGGFALTEVSCTNMDFNTAAMAITLKKVSPQKFLFGDRVNNDSVLHYDAQNGFSMTTDATTALILSIIPDSKGRVTLQVFGMPGKYMRSSGTSPSILTVDSLTNSDADYFYIKQSCP